MRAWRRRPGGATRGQREAGLEWMDVHNLATRHLSIRSLAEVPTVLSQSGVGSGCASDRRPSCPVKRACGCAGVRAWGRAEAVGPGRSPEPETGRAVARRGQLSLVTAIAPQTHYSRLPGKQTSNSRYRLNLT